MAEIEEAQSLNTLFFRSKKRTYDMFLTNYGSRLSNDSTSLKLKLACKINDDYAQVKDLPPPAPVRAAPPEQKKEPQTQAQAVSKGKEEEDVAVKGTHAFPSRPGVALSESNAESAEVTESGYQQLVQSLPASKAQEETAKQAHSIIAYQGAAKINERIQAPPSSKSRALALRNPYLQMKPDWHAPWKLMRVISGHLGWVRAIAVDPSNDWFATGAADRTIKIWDLASGVLKLTLTGHINAVRGLAVSPRHPYLFSCGEDKMVKCWDLEMNKTIRHYHGHLSGVYCIALHPTLDILVTGGRDSTARVWDMRTKAAVHVLTGHTNTVGTVACQSTDPQVISGSHDSTIRLWDLAKGATSATLTHHKKSVRSIALHPTEYTMVSGSPDNIKQWKFPDGQFIKNFSGHNSIINTVAVNRDNVLISGADNGSMYFWDWKTGYNFQKIQTTVQPGSMDSEAGIMASTFDMTGSRFITCEADKTIKVYKEDENATEETHPIVDWKPSMMPKKF